VDWVTHEARVKQFTKHLTPRQRDIVQLCAEGYPIKQIASQLNVSVKTVEFYKRHIMESFNLKSNADLVLFALKQGLISNCA
jgi:DNA-binding NarL/FixJ family response regulator